MSYYNPSSDLERLQIQSDIHERIDQDAINNALIHIPSINKPIRVLDVGCGDGTVTHSRFGSSRFAVNAIDLNSIAIERAISLNKNDNINYICGDIIDQNFDTKFDLIWGAQFLQHVKNPDMVLNALWSMLKPNGVMVFRNSDDGMDTTYPPILGFDVLMYASQHFSTSSDRFVGRKLHNYLKTHLFPKATFVEIQFVPVSNHNKSPTERAALFDVRHGFRLSAIRKAMREDKKIDVQGRDYDLKFFEDTFQRARETFINDTTTISFSVQFLAMAQKPELETNNV